MTDLPAVTAAAEALHDLECCTPGCGPAEKDFRRARHMLEAAAPHITAAEREHCAQLAEQHDAAITRDCACPGGHPGTRGRFASLLREAGRG